MKLGSVSKSGDIWAALWRATHAGHEAMLFIEEKKDADIGVGFIDIVKSPEGVYRWADITVIDGTGFGEQAEKWRKAAGRVINGSVFTDKMEDDREFGMEVAKKLGMNVPEYQCVKTIPEAIKLIQSKPGAYAIKFNGAS